jgi:hypothetical protein
MFCGIAYSHSAAGKITGETNDQIQGLEDIHGLNYNFSGWEPVVMNHLF